MPITRRGFLAATAALAGGLPSLALAKPQITLGKLTIDVLSDGHLTLPGNLVFDGLPATELKQILKRFDISGDEVTPPCNLTLVRDEKRTILFDVGAGPNFQSSTGKLIEAMEAQGVAPEDVTHVVFTHAHPDHLWGVLDDFDELLLPNASYMIGKAEWDYWINPETVNTIGAERQAFAVGAANRFKAIEDKVSFFKPGEEILSGILARDTAGHTPGHMSFEIRSASESAMVIGDAITNHHVAFEKPDWLMGNDQDREMGAKTRTSLLDQLAADKMKVIGFHLPSPGIGYVEKAGAGYRFVTT